MSHDTSEPVRGDDPHDADAGRGLLGSIALFLGLALFCLAAVDQSAGLPFRMPRTWYVNRPLWFCLALGGVIAGCALLRGRRAERPVTTIRDVTLYTRRDCALCDEAKDVLLRYAAELPAIREVDIDEDPELAERYGTSVPVVEIDGEERFRGRVNEVLLRRLIRMKRRPEAV